MRNHVLVVLAIVILMPAAAFADETCSVCDFEPEVITGSVESLGQLQDQMREAEVPIRDYVEDSVGFVERGSSRAVRDFAPWYRHRIDEQNARELQNRMIAEILQSALSAGLNIFLPGSGAVASAIRTYGLGAYEFAVSLAPSGTNDPGPYLEQVAVQLENGNDRLENMTANMFNNTRDTALRDQMQAIRMEYVWEKQYQRAESDPGAGERTPGPDTRRLLRQLGIAEPVTPTYDTTRERVLTKLLNDVMCAQVRGNPVRSCESDRWYYDIVARSAALRLIVTNAQPARMWNLTDQASLDRVCEVEQRLGTGLMGMNADCRRWYDSR